MERIDHSTKFSEKFMVDSLLAAYVMNHSTRFTTITKLMVHCMPNRDSDLGQRGWILDQEARAGLPGSLIRE